MTLTNDQHLAMAEAGNIRLTVDGIECVLVRSDIFDRVRAILGDDWTHEEMRMLLARSSKENGWDAPGMEAYDDYDRNHESR
ncbi:MAG TPA: hypothetical protein VJ783_05035 [Pirellulales bacterium]|nr:hypothetical protein [Pirellulales bacterium]